jgi:hypothetical protein
LSTYPATTIPKIFNQNFTVPSHQLLFRRFSPSQQIIRFSNSLYDRVRISTCDWRFELDLDSRIYTRCTRAAKSVAFLSSWLDIRSCFLEKSRIFSSMRKIPERKLSGWLSGWSSIRVFMDIKKKPQQHVGVLMSVTRRVLKSPGRFIVVWQEQFFAGSDRRFGRPPASNEGSPLPNRTQPQKYNNPQNSSKNRSSECSFIHTYRCVDELNFQN